jgi:hypothetical protein
MLYQLSYVREGPNHTVPRPSSRAANAPLSNNWLTAVETVGFYLDMKPGHVGSRPKMRAGSPAPTSG